MNQLVKLSKLRNLINKLPLQSTLYLLSSWTKYEKGNELETPMGFPTHDPSIQPNFHNQQFGSWNFFLGVDQLFNLFIW